MVPVAGGFVLLMLASGGLLARDAMTIRTALSSAQTSLVRVQQSLGSADVEAAAASLQAADRELGVARSRSRSPLWSAASTVPIVKQPVRTVRGIVDVASAVTDVAKVAVREGGDLVSEGLDVRVADGVVDLQPMQEAGRVVAALPVSQLREVTAALEATRPGISPRQLTDARREVLELADETLGLLGRGDALLSALPGFLGADGPRRYFLGVQTSGELRGTGGLIGFYTVLTVDEGAFALGTVDVYDGLDDAVADGQTAQVVTGPIGQLSGPTTEAVMASAEFTARYAHTEATSRFSNVNVDPDLPTTATVALDLYELRTGERLDGMILVDPVGLQAILEATGSTIPLPADLIAGTDLPDELAATDYVRFVSIDVYDTFGSARSAERKALFAEIGTSAFEEVFSGSWDGIGVTQAIAGAFGGRHLQVFSAEASEQASFASIGATGDFGVPAAGDRLAVIANNAVGGKQDVHVGHRVRADVVLSEPQEHDDELVAQRSSSIRTTLVNPLTPTAFDEYIVGNCLVDEDRNQCFEGPPGWNRTWFSVWTPADDVLQAADGPAGPLGLVAGSFHGQRVFDVYQQVGPQSESWFQLDLEGPVVLERHDDEVIYTWTWWRQAKAIPDLLEVTVIAPDGWNVVAADLTGVGGTGRMLGIDADAEPAQVTVDGATVTVSGSVTRDTTLSVRLERVR